MPNFFYVFLIAPFNFLNGKKRAVAEALEATLFSSSAVEVRGLRLSKSTHRLKACCFVIAAVAEALEVPASVGKDAVAEPVEATLLSSANKNAVAEALEAKIRR